MAVRRRMHRMRRTQQEWSALLAEQADSGMSQREFCEMRGIAVSSFANARRRTRPITAEPSTPPLDEFVAVNLEDAASTPTVRSWDVELALGSGVVLRLRSV